MSQLITNRKTRTLWHNSTEIFLGISLELPTNVLKYLQTSVRMLNNLKVPPNHLNKFSSLFIPLNLP